MKDRYIAEKYQEFINILEHFGPHTSHVETIVVAKRIFDILDQTYEKGKEDGINILQGLNIKK